MFSDPSFYNCYIQLPAANDPVSSKIADNPKFFPFFQNVIGAIDGTHISCVPSAEDHEACRNRKGGVSQNCLASCSFDLHFQHVLTDWEGSVNDATLFADAHYHCFPVLEGKKYLGDEGFPSYDVCIVPYCGTQYHLGEWGRAGLRHVLFNIC